MASASLSHVLCDASIRIRLPGVALFVGLCCRYRCRAESWFGRLPAYVRHCCVEVIRVLFFDL